jgi:hypothetical protein
MSAFRPSFRIDETVSKCGSGWRFNHCSARLLRFARFTTMARLDLVGSAFAHALWRDLSDTAHPVSLRRFPQGQSCQHQGERGSSTYRQFCTLRRTRSELAFTTLLKAFSTAIKMVTLDSRKVLGIYALVGISAIFTAILIFNFCRFTINSINCWSSEYGPLCYLAVCGNPVCMILALFTTVLKTVSQRQ